MSASRDDFLCPICLDVLADPVSTPCEHNFCNKCITRHWDVNPCRCPLCNRVFPRRPQLRVNTSMSEAVSQLRREAGEVPCDVCELKALKSCLVCLSSYCDTHLQTHLRMPGLRRHRLTEPVENLEDRMYVDPLELLCSTQCLRQRLCHAYKDFDFHLFSAR